MYTVEEAEAICRHIAEGNSLVKYCKDNKRDYSAIIKWMNNNPDFAKNYAHAREEQAEYLASEIMVLCDEKPPLIIDKNGNKCIDNGWVTNQKNRIEARKWAAAKLKPRVYGDKQQLEVTGKDGEPLSMRIIAAQQRLLKDITPEPLVIENTADNE